MPKRGISNTYKLVFKFYEIDSRTRLVSIPSRLLQTENLLSVENKTDFKFNISCLFLCLFVFIIVCLLSSYTVYAFSIEDWLLTHYSIAVEVDRERHISIQSLPISFVYLPYRWSCTLDVTVKCPLFILRRNMMK